MALLLDAVGPVTVLLFGLVGALGLSFWVRKTRVQDKSSQPRSSESETLSQKLSPRQRVIFKEAQTVMESGREAEAAKIFTGLGLHRKAVEALLRINKVDEACGILEQVGGADRAGYILGAAGRWEEAQKMFVRAGLFLDAAKCAEELGHYEESARLFEQSGQPLEAARVYETMGNRFRSVRLFIAGGKVERACQIMDAAFCVGSDTPANHQGADLVEALDGDEQQLVIVFLATNPEVREYVELRKALSSKRGKESPRTVTPQTRSRQTG